MIASFILKKYAVKEITKPFFLKLIDLGNNYSEDKGQEVLFLGLHLHNN